MEMNNIFMIILFLFLWVCFVAHNLYKTLIKKNEDYEKEIAEICILNGNMFYEMKNYPFAKHLLQKVLRTDPKNLQVLSLLINVCFEQQDYDGTEKYLKNILEIRKTLLEENHSEMGFLYGKLAHLYRILEKPEEAKYYTELIDKILAERVAYLSSVS